MKNKLLFAILMVSICFVTVAFAQDVPDYLILQDIGVYKISHPEKLIAGFAPMGGPKFYDGSGIISGAGHFPDHGDKTYEVMYLGGDANASPTVQVTQHVGVDSDKWLLHEIEMPFRQNPVQDNIRCILREMNGSRVFTYPKGIHYTWLSNNVIVDIQYSDLQKTKPEPLEVVQAYLQKFPSTIPSTLVLDKAHDQQWIKDEMDRRLWLCDKWLQQLQLEKVKQPEAYQSVVENLNVFLDYREKYYGLKAEDEKNTLSDYLYKENFANIKAKLLGYKEWWTANKSGSLLGLITTCPQRLYGNVSRMFTKLFTFLTMLLGQLFATLG